MPSAVLVVPGPLSTRTGGYIYDRRIAEGLRHLGWSVAVVELGESFPFPTRQALDDATRVFAAMPDGTNVVVDSLALGALPDLIEREASRLNIVALVHLPLSADTDRDPKTAMQLERGERRALLAARSVIATGKAAFPLLEKFALPKGRVVVVEPGTDRAPRARGSQPGPMRLLTVAALTPTKGYEVLVAALAMRRHLDWRLVCAGSQTRHPATLDRIGRLVHSLGLEERVSLLGDLDAVALAAQYDAADVFVSASLRETYGMAVAEALARGLPVVATSTGAAPELVGDDAGLLVPPGDCQALAGALLRIMTDPPLRERLAAGALRVGERLPDWEQASRQIAAAIQSVAVHG
jgi:glycosyltransferase involved in cell wall biosynthesis